jgi:hypothetical protein
VNATRTIPGRPTSSGAAVANEIVDLVAATLDPSPHITAKAVRAELTNALPVLSLLASGGHLVDGSLLLLAGSLRLTIRVPVGEAALTATADSSAPRGAATAENWMLYIPVPESLAAIAESAASTCAHVSTEPPPPEDHPSEAKTSASTIDLTRLLDRNNR